MPVTAAPVLNTDDKTVLIMALEDRINYLRKLNIPDSDNLVIECKLLLKKVGM